MFSYFALCFITTVWILLGLGFGPVNKDNGWCITCEGGMLGISIVWQFQRVHGYIIEGMGECKA